MGSPGGEEVGRVSVRVVPDTSGFAQKLKAELEKVHEEVTVNVRFDLDTAGLRAALEAMRLPAVHVPVEFDVKDPKVDVDADTTGAKAHVDEFVRETDAKKATINVDVNVDQAALEKALATKGGTAKIKVDADTTLAAAKVDALVARESGKQINVKVDVDRSFLDRLSSVFSSIGSFIAKDFGVLTDVISSATSGAMQLGDSFKGVGSAVAGTVGQIVQLGATGTLLATVGAGITAAWGAVSTAIAAVPAAIGLIGAPLAAVALGMDGIKKAAQTLKPEFEKLKTSVSQTFQKGLTQVFTQLKGQLTALTPSIQAVATSLIGLAQQTANWITKAQGAAQIQAVFTNVAAALKAINLVPLIDGFTRLAANQAALKALATTVNEVGEAIKSIADNTSLDAAFAGLEGVLASVTQAFADLVNNGIKLFATAAPGIKSAIDSISGFFNQFDWASLGTSVGGVFKGIGDAIKSIPPATVQAITEGFKKLAATFQSADFANTVRAVAAAIPLFTDALNLAIGAINLIVPRLLGLAQAFMGLANNDWSQLFAGLKQAFTGVPATAEAELGKVPGVIQKQGQAAGQAAQQSFGTVAPAAGTALTPTVQAAQNALGPVPPTVYKALTPMQDMAVRAANAVPGPFGAVLGLLGSISGAAAKQAAGQIKPGLAPMAPAAQQAAQGTQQGLTSGLSGLGQVAQQGAAAGPQGVTAGLSPMEQAAQTEAAKLGPAITTGAAGMAPALQSAFQGLLPVIQTSFTAIQAAFTQAWTSIGTGTTTGLASLAPAVTTALATVTAAVTTWGATLATTFTTAFNTVRTTLAPTETAAWTTWFTTLFTGLSAAITTAMVPLATAFTTGFNTMRTTLTATETAAWTTWFGTLFTSLSAGIATAMAPLATTFTTGFNTMRTTLTTTETAAWTTWFQTLFTGLTAGITAAMVPLTTTFTTGFNTMRTTLTPTETAAWTTWFQTLITALAQPILTAMVPLATTFTTGFNTMRTTLTGTEVPAWQLWFQNLFTQMGTAVTTGMTPLTTAFTTGFDKIRQSVTTSMTTIVDAVKTGMTNMKTAVDTGSQQVVAAFTAMNTKIVAEVNKLPPQMTAIGNNIVKALADAIKAGQSTVVNAIVQMVQAALQAAFSALGINSPSKEFQYIGSSIPEGTAKGINDNTSMVTKAVSNMADAAIDAGSKMVIPAPSLDTGGLAAMHATAREVQSTTLPQLKGLPGTGGGNTTININNAQSATALQLANEVTYQQRTARRGVHAGR